MNQILKAKSWQIFSAIVIVPLLIFISGLFVPAYLINGSYFFFAIPSSIVLSQILLYFWMWSVSSKLYKQQNLQDKFSITTFKIFIIIPIIVILTILAFWLWGASILSTGKFSMANVMFAALWYIVPVQILLIISKFYCFHFTAKVIKSAEQKSELHLEDFITEFLLIIIFPIGIWFLQPRINKLHNN